MFTDRHVHDWYTGSLGSRGDYDYPVVTICTRCGEEKRADFVPTWLQRARSDRGFAKDLTGRSA